MGHPVVVGACPMSALSAVVAGREAAERLMVSRVKIERFTGETIYEGVHPIRERTLVYEGRGKVQSYEAYEQSMESGGGSVTVTRVRVDIPVSAPACRPGDIVTVVENVPDPRLVGMTLRVASLAPFKSLATASRMFAEDITRG